MATISPERIQTLSGTTFELVVQPIKMELRRDPENNANNELVFTWSENLRVDGASRRKDYARVGTNQRYVNSVGSIYPAYAGATDPHSGADLTQISIDGIVQLLLDAFDKMYVQDVT
jgi:hypothetical protein